MKVLINISEQKYKWICENPLVYDSDLEISVRKGIAIPENATNGDMIKAMFPNASVYEHNGGATYSVNNEYNFNATWWNTPYKQEDNE